MGRRVPPLRTPGVAGWQVTGQSRGRGFTSPGGAVVGGASERGGGSSGGEEGRSARRVGP